MGKLSTYYCHQPSLFPGFLPLVYQVTVLKSHGLVWLLSAVEPEKDIFFLSDFACFLRLGKLPKETFLATSKKKNDLMCWNGAEAARAFFFLIEKFLKNEKAPVCPGTDSS